MPPSEVLDRFTEEEMIRLVAYQNLYGPITPARGDIVAARLGMDVAAPHMKRGRKPKLRDHLIVWHPRSTPRKTPRQMLETIKGIQSTFDQADRRRAKRRRKKGGGGGDS
ncbi:phage tail assembly protein T [Streptomyces sp. WMMC897]|uniref:phage tail assembly protein T n=1 Tax=Streptomyces sp. WMMC897 TaxID=3014782 RepID=UPI0022B7492B|nr:hypothetical protein [Streptomyces sp. WMMC897]MCZ7414319.1 hypothetical protein [Streptomyces sp. WMMC897]